MVLVIDNYDSFTYNLVQYLGELGAQIEVRRNDETSVEAIRALAPSRIVISPGPGRPEEAGVSLDVIRAFGPALPILGVCLGHQAIGLAFGGQRRARAAPDSRQDLRGGPRQPGCLRRNGAGLPGWPLPLADRRRRGAAGRLIVSARTRGDGIIMGLRHRAWPVHGVQFHPESVLTPEGRQLLRNFLESK